MANPLKSPLSMIAIAAAVATTVQIASGDAPPPLPASAESLPRWLATPPNPWFLLTALVALLAGATVLARRRAAAARREAARRPPPADPRRPFPWSLTPGERKEAERLGLFGGPPPELPDLDDPQVRSAPGLAVAAATREFTLRLVLARRLAAAPGMYDMEREVWDSHIKLGEIEMMARSFVGAMFSFEAALDLVERWATGRAPSGGWHIPMLETHLKLGDAARAIGIHSSMRAHYEHGLRIAEQLAAGAGDAGAWHNLLVVHNKLGDGLAEAGDLTAARRHLEASLDIAERQAAAEPRNVEARRDRFVVEAHFGRLAHAEGDSAEAMRRFDKAEAIIRDLAREAPEQRRFGRDLTWLDDCMRKARG